MLLYYDQLNYEEFFGLYVSPGSSEVGLTFLTCSNVTNKIPIYNPIIHNDTELFLAISISPVNITHVTIVTLIGEDTSVSTMVVAGSLECSSSVAVNVTEIVKSLSSCRRLRNCK